MRQNVGFGVNQRVNQRQLEAALRGYRFGYRATGYRRQNVGFAVTAGVTAAVTSVRQNTGWAVNRRVNPFLLTTSFDAYRLAYRATAHQHQRLDGVQLMQATRQTTSARRRASGASASADGSGRLPVLILAYVARAGGDDAKRLRPLRHTGGSNTRNGGELMRMGDGHQWQSKP